MGISIKNTRSADFCADHIDVITNFADITNVVIKRVHCTREHTSVLGSMSVYLKYFESVKVCMIYVLGTMIWVLRQLDQMWYP